MANESGEVFCADDAEDAAWFAREHGASPLNPDAFRAMFGDVEGVGS